MRIPRIFCANKSQENMEIELNANASNHVLYVLRLKIGAPVILFNGTGGEFNAKLIAINKKQRAVVQIEEFVDQEVESPLKIYLGQGISRGEKMDYTIQKAVELGVHKIIPLYTERCNVKLDKGRMDKRLLHWRKIVISACEQSGRNRIPLVETIKNLPDWLAGLSEEFRLVLHHRAPKSISSLPQKLTSVVILVGPEGGLSEREMQIAKQNNFIPIQFGQRILRTETAALSAISILQSRWGDMG